MIFWLPSGLNISVQDVPILIKFLGNNLLCALITSIKEECPVSKTLPTGEKVFKVFKFKNGQTF
jgi:hypothetical protein